MYKSLVTSILNTKETVSKYAIERMAKEGVIKIDRKVMEKELFKQNNTRG